MTKHYLCDTCEDKGSYELSYGFAPCRAKDRNVKKVIVPDGYDGDLNELCEFYCVLGTHKVHVLEEGVKRWALR